MERIDTERGSCFTTSSATSAASAAGSDRQSLSAPHAERRMQDRLAKKLASSNASSSPGPVMGVTRATAAESDVVPGAVSVPGTNAAEAVAVSEVRGSSGAAADEEMNDTASSSLRLVTTADAGTIAIPDATLVAPDEDFILTVTADPLVEPTMPPPQKFRDALRDRRVLIVLVSLLVVMIVIVAVVVPLYGKSGDDGGSNDASTNAGGQGGSAGSLPSPSSLPSLDLSSMPSSLPSLDPSSMPSSLPSVVRSELPTALPSSSPSSAPYCPVPLRYSNRIPIGEVSASTDRKEHVLDTALNGVVEVTATAKANTNALSTAWFYFRNSTGQTVGDLNIIPNDYGSLTKTKRFDPPLQDVVAVHMYSWWNPATVSNLFLTASTYPHPIPKGEVVPFGDYEYKMSDSTGKWDEHRTAAQEWGGELASIHSEEENDFIRSLINATVTQAFLGGSRDSQDLNAWLWSDGTPWDYMQFCPGEPNNYALGHTGEVEGVVELSRYLPYCGYGWNDQRATVSIHAVYKRRKPTLRAHEYKISDAPLTWEDHKVEAMGWGGDLVSIRSEEENALVLSLVEPTLERAFLGGRRNTQSPSEWAWSDGHTWDYTDFCPGEPNNLGGIEDAIAMTTDTSGCSSGWNDQPNTELMHAIYRRTQPFFLGYEYRISYSALTWDDHRAEALKWGGDLASIHSSDEHAFVYSLAYSAASTSAQFFVGGKRNPENSLEWIWSDGSAFDYENFCPGEPNYDGDDENVIEIATYLSGCAVGWNDRSNSSEIPAIYKRVLNC